MRGRVPSTAQRLCEARRVRASSARLLAKVWRWRVGRGRRGAGRLPNQVGEVGADGDVVLVGPQLALPELEERRLLPQAPNEIQISYEIQNSQEIQILYEIQMPYEIQISYEIQTLVRNSNLVPDSKFRTRFEPVYESYIESCRASTAAAAAPPARRSRLAVSDSAGNAFSGAGRRRAADPAIPQEPRLEQSGGDRPPQL